MNKAEKNYRLAVARQYTGGQVMDTEVTHKADCKVIDADLGVCACGEVLLVHSSNNGSLYVYADGSTTVPPWE